MALATNVPRETLVTKDRPVILGFECIERPGPHRIFHQHHRIAAVGTQEQRRATCRTLQIPTEEARGRDGKPRLDVAAHVHIPVQDADDFHHVRAHPIEHHMRADSGLAVTGPDVFGRPAGQGAVAQRLAGITDVPRVLMAAKNRA